MALGILGAFVSIVGLILNQPAIGLVGFVMFGGGILIGGINYTATGDATTPRWKQ